MKKRPQKTEPSSPNAGNSKTRQRLLETAGQIFAEKGFHRTTSKEITEQAGTNSAAVNYYFEGIEGLYAAVLNDAASLMMPPSDMQAVVSAQPDAKVKLEAFLGLFIKVITSPAASSWRLRVLIREFSSPVLVDHSPPKKGQVQKMRLLKGIVAELMGLPENHPAVARGCISVMGPCFMLMICDRPTLKQALPQFALQPDDAPTIIQHMTQFALAGLAAVAAEVQPDTHKK